MSGAAAGGGAGDARRGIALAFAAMAMFAGIDVCSKLLGATLPVLEIVWLRFALFIPLAAALARRSTGRIAWRSARPGLQVARTLVLVVEMWFYIAAFAALPLADVHAIGAIAPLLVTALAVPVLGEQVGWRRWSAVALGCAGVMVILRPGFAAIGTPMLYALAGAALWAVYQLLLRIIGRVDSAETTALWTAVVGALVSGLAVPFVWVWPSPAAWLLVAAAVVLGGFGHMTYARAFTLAPAATLQPFNYLMLVFATLFGWLVFGDFPDAWTIAGALVIVASGLYAFHRERVRAAAD